MNTDKLTEPAIILLIEYLGAAWLAFATEERAGLVDIMSSTLDCRDAGGRATHGAVAETERKPVRVWHWAVAVERW